MRYHWCSSGWCSGIGVSIFFVLYAGFSWFFCVLCRSASILVSSGLVVADLSFFSTVGVFCGFFGGWGYFSAPQVSYFLCWSGVWAMCVVFFVLSHYFAPCPFNASFFWVFRAAAGFSGVVLAWRFTCASSVCRLVYVFAP